MKASEKEPKKDRLALAPTAHPAKEEMVTQYLPLVRLVAERVHRRPPPGVDLESLIHSGVVGLLQPKQIQMKIAQSCPADFLEPLPARHLLAEARL